MLARNRKMGSRQARKIGEKYAKFRVMMAM
jgi:hypothetical protein